MIKTSTFLLASAVSVSALATAGTLLSQSPPPAAPPGTKPQPSHVQPAGPRPNQNPQQPTAPNAPGTPANPNQPNQPNQPTDPNQPNQQQPAQPGQPVAPDGVTPLDPVLPAFPDPNDPNLTPEQREMILRLRSQQPFTFTSPQAEARFNDTARRLARFEQRLERTNQDQLRRLGEIRTMAPERQGAAMMDLIQQVLISQRDLQRYLVAARSNLTGQFELPPETLTATNGAQPAQNPGIPPIR